MDSVNPAKVSLSDDVRRDLPDGTGVGEAVGVIEGDGVGYAEGWKVGRSVGKAVGSWVGKGEGDGEGLELGSTVGRALGAGLGDMDVVDTAARYTRLKSTGPA